MVDTSIIQSTPYGSPTAAPEKIAADAHVYKTMAQFGEEAANVFNDIAYQRTQAESALYEVNSRLEMKKQYNYELEAMEKNPNIDWVKDGRKVIDSFNSKMQATSDSFVQNAPTSLAAKQVQPTLLSDAGVLLMRADDIRSKGLVRSYDTLTRETAMTLNRSVNGQQDVEGFDRLVERSLTPLLQANEGNLIPVQQVEDNKIKMTTGAFQNYAMTSFSVGRPDNVIQAVYGKEQSVMIRKNMDAEGKLLKPIATPIENNPEQVLITSQNADGEIVQEIVNKYQKGDALLLTFDDTRGASRHYKNIDPEVSRKLVQQALASMAKKKQESYFNVLKSLDSVNKNATAGKVSAVDLQSFKVAEKDFINYPDQVKSKIISSAANIIASRNYAGAIYKNPNLTDVEMEQLADGSQKALVNYLASNEESYGDFSKLAQNGGYTGGDQREFILNTLKSYRNAAKAQLESDPAAYVTQRSMDASFQGAFKGLFGVDASGTPLLASENPDPQSMSVLKKSMPSFMSEMRRLTNGEKVKFIPKDFIGGFKDVANKSMLDTVKFNNLAVNLKGIFGEDNFDQVAAELGLGYLKMAQMGGTEGVDHYNAVEQNKDSMLKQAQQKYVGKDISKTVLEDAGVKKYIQALTNGNPANRTLVDGAIKAITNEVIYNAPNQSDINDNIKKSLETYMQNKRMINASQGWFKSDISTFITSDLTEDDHGLWHRNTLDRMESFLGENNIVLSPPKNYDRTAYEYAIKTNGVWIGKEDGSGLKLMYPKDDTGELVDAMQVGESGPEPIEASTYDIKTYSKAMATKKIGETQVNNSVGRFGFKISAKSLVSSPEDYYKSNPPANVMAKKMNLSTTQDSGLVNSFMTRETGGYKNFISNFTVEGVGKGNETKDAPSIAAGIKFKDWASVLNKSGVDTSFLRTDSKGIAHLYPEDFDNWSVSKQNNYKEHIWQKLKPVYATIIKDVQKNVGDVLQSSQIRLNSSQFEVMTEMAFMAGINGFKNSGIVDAFKKYQITGSKAELKKVMSTASGLSSNLMSSGKPNFRFNYLINRL